MSTFSGVGSSTNSDSRLAASEAAKMALKNSGAEKADLAIIFTTSKHDPKSIREGLRSVLGPQTHLIGGHGVGIITKDHLSYGGYEVGVAVLTSDKIKFNIFKQPGLGTGQEYQVGEALAKQIIQKHGAEDYSLFLMYDSVKMDPRHPLNLATPLLQGMERVFGARWPTVAGAGLFGDLQFSPCFQWFDDEVNSQTAMALTFSGAAKMDVVIYHGCKPASDYHRVTKSEGPVILEIDGEPAVLKVQKMLGPNSGVSVDNYPLFLQFGVNYGEKFDEFDPNKYAIRLCMAVDKERNGLVMFEPDIKPGDEIQLMRRNLDFSDIQKTSDDFFGTIGSRKPVLAIYADCAGRAAAFCSAQTEEAAEIQKFVATKVPTLGFYSGVEIAKVGENIRALDWTGVLCVVSE